MSNEDEMFCLMMKKCACGTGPSEGGKLPDLSYDEQEAGFKDVDGRKVYVRTFGPINFAAGTISVPHNIANIKNLVKFEMYIKTTSGCYISAGNLYYGSSNHAHSVVDETSIHLAAQGGMANGYALACTIYYTCTDR